MGIEDYNLLKSTLEEVATLRENRKKNRRDLKGLKKNLADLEQELPILRDNLEGVTSREGKMPSNNEIENELIHIREGEKTAKEEADRLYARRSIAEKRIKDSEGFVRNESIVLFLVLAACAFVLTMIIGASPPFECENGESVNYFFVDDGGEDCLDGSDERPTEADAERASFIIGCIGFLLILISIIVFAFDLELYCSHALPRSPRHGVLEARCLSAMSNSEAVNSMRFMKTLIVSLWMSLSPPRNSPSCVLSNCSA